MGGELKQILENQRKLEEQFEQLTMAEQLKEQAHSLSATAQGISYVQFIIAWHLIIICVL